MIKLLLVHDGKRLWDAVLSARIGTHCRSIMCIYSEYLQKRLPAETPTCRNAYLQKRLHTEKSADRKTYIQRAELDRRLIFVGYITKKGKEEES